MSVVTKKEVVWDFREVAGDTTGARERCTRRLAQTVTRNAKFLSNRAETARSTAKTAFQSARTKGAKNK